MKKLIASAVFLIVASTSVLAVAKRKHPLDDQPAVRKRIKYLPMRFEMTANVGFTFLQDFQHYFVAGAKFEFHVNDWFSFGAFINGMPVGWDTDLTNEIEKTLPTALGITDVDPSPSRRIMKRALDGINLVAGAFIAYTPWFGKLSLFGKAFVNFDFHILLGGGIAWIKPGKLPDALGNCADANAAIDSTGTCANLLHIDRRKKNGGIEGGPIVGFGIRFWLKRWVSFNIQFQAMFVQRNQAGFDKNGDAVTEPGRENVIIVDNKDKSWEPLMTFTFGVSFWLPPSAPRSR